jgi:hypothetical protein
MARVLVGLFVACIVLSGCDNSCQNLCVQMADFSEECEAPVGAAELEACIDDFADATSEDLAICRDYGSGDVVRRQWTCDDLTLYNTP